MEIKSQWIIKNKPLIDIIEKYGGEARFVGGCVRDSIINKQNFDIDIATTLNPVRILDIFSREEIKAIPTGIKHGTITVIFQGESIEITTLRKDLKCFGRHAEVDFTTEWLEDAERRDFTFNALYCDKNGNIFDYFDGIKDLHNKTLKFIGNAENRIQEDYLRILRAFRFFTALNITTIDFNVLKLFQRYAAKLKLLSGERIKSEFFKILSYNNSFNAIKIMQECKLIKEIFLCTLKNISKYNDNLPTLKNIQSIEKFAVLIIISDSKNKKELLQKLNTVLKLSNKEYKKLAKLISLTLSSNIYSDIYLHTKEIILEILNINLILQKLDYNTFIKLQKKTINFKVPIFPISGNDIIKIKITGRNIGITLKKLEQYWISKQFSLSKTELLNKIKL